MMKLLFIPGVRGRLAANHDGKFYFPDSKSNINEGGLYECEVTVDKDKYAFVNGTIIETYMPSSKFISEYIGYCLFANSSISEISEFEIKSIGVSTIIFIKRRNFVDIGYVNEHDELFDICQHKFSLHRISNISSFYDVRNFQDDIRYQKEKINAVKDIAMTIDNCLLKAITAIVCSKRIGFYKWEPVNNIKIYDDKFVIIETEYHGHVSTRIFAYSKKYGVIELDSIFTVDDFRNKTFDIITMDDVFNWMIEHHVGTGGFGEEMIYDNRVEFTNQYITITCINGCQVMNDISDDDKIKVEKSFEQLDAFKKRIGKNISKSMMKDLVKLSPRHVLGLEH